VAGEKRKARPGLVPQAFPGRVPTRRECVPGSAGPIGSLPERAGASRVVLDEAEAFASIKGRAAAPTLAQSKSAMLASLEYSISAF